MRDKLAIYTCPTDGCPAIGKSKKSRCNRHDRPMVRVIYELTEVDLMTEINSIFDAAWNEFDRVFKRHFGRKLRG